MLSFLPALILEGSPIFWQKFPKQWRTLDTSFQIGLHHLQLFLSPDRLVVRPPAHLTLFCSLRPKGSEFSVVAQAQMWQTLAGGLLTLSQNDTGFTGLSWIVQLTATGMNPPGKFLVLSSKILHAHTNWQEVHQIVPPTAFHCYSYWDSVQSSRLGEETYNVCSTAIVIGAVSLLPGTFISRNLFFLVHICTHLTQTADSSELRRPVRDTPSFPQRADPEAAVLAPRVCPGACW